MHFIRWYVDHGKTWLDRCLSRLAGRVGVAPAGLDVRDLGHRWGSCGKDGNVSFHWATILLPPSVVEYVAVHELVHLREPHHSAEFWRRVERTMPDYEERRRWLADRGAVFVAL
jgi:predicted metal-dependent hydrolase